MPNEIRIEAINRTTPQTAQACWTARNSSTEENLLDFQDHSLPVIPTIMLPIKPKKKHNKKAITFDIPIAQIQPKKKAPQFQPLNSSGKAPLLLPALAAGAAASGVCVVSAINSLHHPH